MAPSPGVLTRGKANNAVLTAETLTLLPSDDEFETQRDDINNNTINEEGDDDDDDDNNEDKAENRRWTAKIFGDSATMALQYSDDDEYWEAQKAMEEDDDDDNVIIMSTKRRGGRKLLKGLPALAPKDAPEHVKEAAKVDRRREYQKARRKKLKEGSYDDDCVVLTGNHCPTLRPMAEVKNDRLERGQVFSNKDIIELRVKEEANLRGITIKTAKSDSAKYVVWSEDALDFYVHANHSYGEYRVKHAIVRPMDVDDTWNGEIHGVKIHPINKAEEEAAELAAAAKVAAASPSPMGMKGKGKGKGKGKAKKDMTSTTSSSLSATACAAAGGTSSTMSTTLRKVVTPYNAADLVPLLVTKFQFNPNSSNEDMRVVLKPYGVEGVFTDNLLQNTRRRVREQLFGTPDRNVQYTYHLKAEMEQRGHKVKVYVTNKKNTQRAMYDVLWDEECMRRKRKVSIRTDDKKSFCEQWLKENKEEVYQLLGHDLDHLEFLHGIFFAPSVSVSVVPHLQKVFQADAAHVAWGKFTLFSLYGTTANGNMFPVVLGVHFGNENYVSWSKFWQFAVETHPCLNHPDITIITDQCKGSIGAIREHAAAAHNFHCSYHRLDNVNKYCKGGQSKFSPHWVMRKLIGCNNMASLEHQMDTLCADLEPDVLKYFKKLPNSVQFPAARCAMSESIFLYDHEASSGVESMNNANKKVRHMAAVDPVNSTTTLVGLESSRYEKIQKKVWEWTSLLTPKGEELCHAAFEVQVSGKYTYDVVTVGTHHETKVRLTAMTGGVRTHTVKTPREAVHGSRFGLCTCGITQTKTLPCEHMVAIVQAQVVPGLTQLNIMPTWCSTAVW